MRQTRAHLPAGNGGDDIAWMALPSVVPTKSAASSSARPREEMEALERRRDDAETTSGDIRSSDSTATEPYHRRMGKRQVCLPAAYVPLAASPKEPNTWMAKRERPQNLEPRSFEVVNAESGDFSPLSTHISSFPWETPPPSPPRMSRRAEARSGVYQQHNTHHRMRVDLFQDTDALGCCGALRLSLSNAWRSLLRLGMFMKLTWIDCKARTGTYVISFCSVFFVVLLCVAMISVLTSLPILFLRLAEPSAGQADLVLTPGGQLSQASSLNYTAIRGILSAYPDSTHLHAPRVEFYAYAFAPRTCRTRQVADLWFPFPQGNATTSAAAALAGGGRAATAEMTAEMAAASGEMRRVCARTCYDEWCQTQVGPVVTVYALNTTQEDVIGYGPYAEYPYETPPKGYALISAQVATDVNVRAGDDIFLVADELDGLLDQFYANVPEGRRNYNVLLQLKVKVVAKSYSYKFPDTDSFVLVNYDHLGEMLAQGMSPLMSSEDRESVARVPTDYAASAVYFRMPASTRYDAYVHSSYNTIRTHVREWGAVIVEALGANQLSPSTPILTFLKTIEFFSVFVGLIMSIIILALAFLSVLLIYSLLTVGLDTRTYELGIQRMVGFTRENLVAMVLCNAYFFTIPAWLLGLAAGQGIYSLMRLVLKQAADVELPVGVSGASIGWASLAGLLIPLVASIFPIWNLLTLKLPEALDSNRGRTTGVIYKIKRNDSARLNGTMLGLGFLFALLGFLLYYLFPNSLVNQNLSLMFYIFFFVLIGMLAGLVLLATNFQRVVETVLLYVLLFWESRPVFRMVRKSLAAHRLRNRKTTLMYALSLAFIVFVTVAFNIQVVSMEYSSKRSMGSDVVVNFASRQRPLTSYGQTGSDTYDEGVVDPAYDDAGRYPGNFSSDSADSDSEETVASPYKSRPAAPTFYEFNYGVNFYLDDYLQLRKELKPWMDAGVVSATTYRGVGLLPIAWNLQYLYIQTPGRYRTSGWTLHPIPPDFYNTVNPSFVRVNRYNEDAARYGISEALYTREGMRKLTLATTTYRLFSFASLDSPGICRSGLRTNETSRTVGVTDTPRVFSTSTVMDSSAVFLMTKYANNLGDILLSYPALAHYSGIPYFSVRSMPFWNVFIRVPNKANYGRVKTTISHFMSRNGFYPRVNDVESSTEDIRTANNILTIFFIFALIMILVICFFSLMSSMTANVLDSSKEIAVLLCMGMTHFQLYRVYIWEAFLLLLASGLLGLLVGVIVAYTMQMQNVLFTQLSIPFNFPYIQLCIIVGVGMLSALAASVGPVSYLLGLPSITHILRRTVN